MDLRTIQHIITYPISHGKYLNFVGFVTIPGGEGTIYPHKWVRDVKKEDVLAAYPGWEPEVDQMLSVFKIILTHRGPLSSTSLTVS